MSHFEFLLNLTRRYIMKDAFSAMSCNDIKFRNGDGSFEELDHNWEGEIVDEERKLYRNSDIDQLNLLTYDASPSSQTYYETMKESKKNKSE